MKNEISVRQICFILAAYGAVTKLMYYPSAAAGAAGCDLIFPALFNVALQTAAVWAVAYLSSRTDKTFFGLVEGVLGKIAARVIYALFALYFLFAAIVPLSEQQLFVHDAFYDTVPSLFTFLPVFIFLIYAGAKHFTNVGRCADICFPLFAVTAVIIMFMSAGSGNYSNLLPVLKQPAQNVAKASLSSLFRFTESAVLLMFVGHYKYRRGDSLKMTLSYAAGGLAVVAFMGIYYAVYGQLTPSRTFILNNICVFSSSVNFIGRVDLLAVYVADAVILFAVALNVQLCVHCLCLAAGREWRSAFSLAANGALIAVTLIFGDKFSLLQRAAAGWFWIPALAFAYAMPLFAWVLKGVRKNERTHV